MSDVPSIRGGLLSAVLRSLVGNAHTRQVYGRLLRYVRPHWRMFGVAVLGMLAFAATEPIFAALMKPLIDGGFVDKEPDALRNASIALIALFVVRGVAGFISMYCLSWVGRRVVADLRQAMFEHLLRAPARYYDQHGSGFVLAKLTYNVENVAKAATSAVTVLIRDGFVVIGLTLYMLYISVALTAVLLVIGPVLGLSVKLATRKFRDYGRRIQHRMGELTHVAQQVIDAHRVVKAFGGSRHEAAVFGAVNEKTRSLQMKLIATESASVPLVQLIIAVAIAIVIYFASVQGLRNEISVGAFMSFVVALGLLLPPIKRLTEVNAHLQRGIVAAESLFELLDSESEIDSGKRHLVRAVGRIEFRGIVHRYRPDETAIDNLDLIIEPGEKIALLGRSGSGKSTLASLLLRFYEPDDGEILLDDIPIREFTLSSLRAQISLVSQDVSLFNDSVANNIAYGRAELPTREALERVATAAHAMEFIRELPEGFETHVGDRGVLLSGGQRQRLAIARAMLKDAPILILDEATSALDTESERYIQAALEKLMAGRTTLIIAHRLSTIQNADRIVVLEQGKIVEQGPPAVLE
ncbi:MAG: lipid A export permease/ATP-binding protein MsbA, partial [Chromatiaceae bacterium]